jgi:ATP-dependent Lon protease
MYSDKRMEGWWLDNLLEDTIDKYKKKGDLKNGGNLDPSSFLQHLNDGKDYLHYGVNIYLRRLYKDYNGVGHHALFKKADSNFNRAVDAAKKAALEKNKQQKRKAAAAQRNVIEEMRKVMENRQQLEAEALKQSERQLKLAKYVAEEKRKQDEQKRLAEEAEERQRQATKQKEEDARIEEVQRRLAEDKERNLLAEENRQRREPPSQLQVTIKESLRDKIYQQLAMVAGTDTSQLESYVPKEILELTDEEEENQWNAKKDAAAKFAITSVIEKLDEDGFAIDADEKAKITDFFTCLMENNYVFDMGFRVDYGNNSVRCWCPCW